MRKMTRIARKMSDDIIQEMAEETKNKLHEVVNSSPSPMNTEKTEKRKGFNVPLHWTGGMMDEDSIIVKREKDGDKAVYSVQGNPHKKYKRDGKETGLTYEDIIAISETGGGVVPAREVLTIAYAEVRQKIERMCISRLNEELVKDD